LVERGVTDNLLRTEELAENRIKNLGEKKSWEKEPMQLCSLCNYAAEVGEENESLRSCIRGDIELSLELFLVILSPFFYLLH
jgi:hypothetical protein